MICFEYGFVGCSCKTVDFDSFVSHMIDFLDVLAGLFCYVLAFSLVSYHIFAGCLFRWFAKSVISGCFRWFSVFVSDILLAAGSLAK